MDFIDQLKQFSKRVESLKDTIDTEEATKTAVIMPFFAMLGYDIFNPQEFVPEYTADVGIKKGEKVDYAIIKDDEPVILVECKSISENLGKHDSQAVPVLRDDFRQICHPDKRCGVRFYTDLDNPNKMDEAPFLTINILDIRDNQVPELKKFCKSVFDIDSIFSTASELKYVQEFKRTFSAQLETPSDDFTRLFLQDCYSGPKTQNVIEKFRPILRKALNDLISEMMNDKIKAAFGSAPSVQESSPKAQSDEPDLDDEAPVKKGPQIETTEEELEAYFIIKNLVADVADIHDITYKDTASYFNILYKGNVRKWICRIRINSAGRALIIPDENKKETVYALEDIYDLKNHKDTLCEVLKRYL